MCIQKKFSIQMGVDCFRPCKDPGKFYVFIARKLQDMKNTPRNMYAN